MAIMVLLMLQGHIERQEYPLRSIPQTRLCNTITIRIHMVTKLDLLLRIRRKERSSLALQEATRQMLFRGKSVILRLEDCLVDTVYRIMVLHHL